MRIKTLVVVDGLDGCGKDTHAERILDFFHAQGGKVVLRRHPSSGFCGRMSKRALQRSGRVAQAVATMFYTLDVLRSVRAYYRQDEGTMIFVRYLLGTAYLPRRLAPSAYRLFRKTLPFPDLAIFIDIEPGVALRRIEQRDHKREMFETIEKLSRVRSVVKQIVDDEWVVVNNSEDGERPFDEVRRILSERFGT